MATRGLAAFLGSFTLLNLLGNVLAPGFDSNEWWIDLRPMPPFLAATFLLASSLLLIASALYAPRSRWRRRATAAVVAALAVVTLANAATFYVLLARGTIRSSVPLPLSLLICAALVAIGWRSVRGRRVRRFSISVRRGDLQPKRAVVTQWPAVAMFTACLVAFPLAQTWFFGHTDYRRPADAIVVFGARAGADGTPSAVLADRVRTGCALYNEGLASVLVFSGGPGDGTVSEPRAMRRMALSLGVPDRAIRLDERGLNTAATVANTAEVLASEPVEGWRGKDSSGTGTLRLPMHPRLPLPDSVSSARAAAPRELIPTGRPRLLAVSNAYHLPRIKLAYQRAGWEVYTVPAAETFRLPNKSFLLAREVAALWTYYLHLHGR